MDEVGVGWMITNIDVHLCLTLSTVKLGNFGNLDRSHGLSEDGDSFGSQFNQGESTMLVDVEIRERLSHYCTVTKQTQEKAANLALREMLERCEQDPTLKGKMDRVKALKEELASL
jgi:hypothetical protein